MSPEETTVAGHSEAVVDAGGPADTGLVAMRILVGALALALAELSAVLSTRVGSLFLGFDEQEEYFLALASLAPLLVGAVFAGGKLVSRLPPSVRSRAIGALAMGASFALGAALTTGRRVHEHPLRWPVVLGVAALAGLVVVRATPVLSRRLGASRPLALFSVLVATAACFADILVLPRLYPAFHMGLRVAAWLAAAGAGAFVPLPAATQRPRWGQAARVLIAVCALVGPWRAWVLSDAPNLSFVLGEHVPLTGRPVALLASLRAPQAASASGAELVDVSPTDGGGFSLEDRNVLLITVDALRADRLRAYGGTGLTPEMDALADESVVFERAYTPTPHTSYALTSLLCGKYLRPVLELPGAEREHPALPELLRRYGHRTAAFYPPAIFFVDAHRFEALRETHFGFEYRKEEFASGAERVGQLRDYLELSDTSHPLFAWVHLFEPHEPYDPPDAYRRGDSAVERYDGEVAAADAAVGELIRTFRASRPGATVILSADHGEEFGDHGGHYHGSTLYDEQVRVPLLWSTPGVTEGGRRVGAPVELIDLSTTLLAALGIPRDARMRGDDLGALLRSGAEAEGAQAPRYAFAGIMDERMVVDGRYKAICRGAGASCRLYDLQEDPEESRNVAGEQPERLRALQAALASFVGSIPRVEGMTVGAADVGWPEALARARLGDPEAAVDVVPLLGDPRAPVRAAAASALGTLGHAAALPALVALAGSDTDAVVRVEAALAALTLHHVFASGGEGGPPVPGNPADALPPRLGPALAEARGLLTHDPAGTASPRGSGPPSDELQERAALALAKLGDDTGAAILRALIANPDRDEEARREAVAALAHLQDRDALPALVALLPDARLSVAAADALAAVGDPRAAGPLLTALAGERYLPAREAQVRALGVLGERRAVPLIWRFMGVDRPVRTGLEALRQLGALRRFTGRGGLLASAPSAALRGTWQCGDEGCAPGAAASIQLSAAGRVRGPGRVIVVVRPVSTPRGEAHEPAGGIDVDIEIEIDGTRHPLRGAETWLTFLDDGAASYTFAENDRVAVVAVFRVAPAEELPAPEAEPWDAGVQAASAGADAGPSPAR